MHCRVAAAQLVHAQLAQHDAASSTQLRHQRSVQRRVVALQRGRPSRGRVAHSVEHVCKQRNE
jgi:hypothetical protein